MTHPLIIYIVAEAIACCTILEEKQLINSCCMCLTDSSPYCSFHVHIIPLLCVDCCILINGDPSISRVHAKLLVQANGAVFITDVSKYGTLVNSKKLTKDQQHHVKEGDVIKFGNQPNKSEFRLVLFLSVMMIYCT